MGDRNQKRMLLKRKQRRRAISNVMDRTITNDNIRPLAEIDWQQSIQRLYGNKDENDPIMIHYKIPIPKHRKYANKKDSLQNRTPLFEWFAKYGFKTVQQSNLAFIVSHDYVFRFEGAQYLNKIYHSQLTDTAIIVLIFDDDKDVINAYYMEQSKANSIQFRNNYKKNGGDDDVILQYLNAPFIKKEEKKQKKRSKPILSSISTTTSNTIDSSSHHRNDTLSPLSPATSQTGFVKSYSVDILSHSPLNESIKEEKINDIDHMIKEQKEETYILSTIRSHSASTLLKQNTMQQNASNAKQIGINESRLDAKSKRVRRWSFSENNGQEYKQRINGIDFKHSLIDNIMKVQLPEIITDLCQLWYVLPDCEFTFLSLIDAINIYDNQYDDDDEQHKKHRMNIRDIDLSRLKKLRKYFWRKPLKYMVQQYLADSKKEESALVQILSNLQSAVMSGDSMLSFLSFIKCCKNSSKIQRLIVSSKIINSPSIHLFILVQAIHKSQQPLLIHFFLSEKDKDRKENDDGDENENGNKKLVMEIIGRCKPKKSAMNRQCLSDLISMTEVFVKKRNV